MPSTARRRSQIALGTIFTGVSVFHFLKRDFFAKLVPAPLRKYEREVDYATEALMATAGMCFWIPKTSHVARWMTTAILVPTFPSAIGQVRHPEQLEKVGLPPKVAPVRVVAQLGMLTWIWWATKRPAATNSPT